MREWHISEGGHTGALWKAGVTGGWIVITKWNWFPFFKTSVAAVRQLAGFLSLPLSCCRPSARPRAL